MDRVDPNTGELIEIGPSHSRRLKTIESQQYAEWMNKLERRFGGEKWWPTVRTYDQARLIQWLKNIGYLER
ncbi:hypothetical protein D3C84_1157260 [compost metagenome]